jgi:hypothetical protein
MISSSESIMQMNWILLQPSTAILKVNANAAIDHTSHHPGSAQTKHAP